MGKGTSAVAIERADAEMVPAVGPGIEYRHANRAFELSRPECNRLTTPRDNQMKHHAKYCIDRAAHQNISCNVSHGSPEARDFLFV